MLKKMGKPSADNLWVGFTVRTGEGPEDWYGQLECTLEEFLRMPDTDFVRLNHAVWVEVSPDLDQAEIVANEDNPDIPFEHFLYIRKGDISVVRPIKYPLNPPAVSD